jgi:ElaB/YqjD/DUF883 family membrane-anchored ribosome-binding protein
LSCRGDIHEFSVDDGSRGTLHLRCCLLSLGFSQINLCTFMKNRYETASSETPEQLIEHISRLMAEAEAMLAGPVTHPGMSSGRLAEIQHRLEDARMRLGGVYDRARTNVVASARYTDETIREHPYYSIAIAVGIGIVVGMLLKPR